VNWVHNHQRCLAFSATICPIDRRSNSLIGQTRQPRKMDSLKRNWKVTCFAIEAALNLVWWAHGPLHPIDYPTYQQQVQKWNDGICNYKDIWGTTGPLVYPAVHIWIFWLIGLVAKDDFTAQLIFMLIQLTMTWFVYRILEKTSPEPWLDATFFYFTVRGRNVFVNGLFNDGISMIFVYLGYSLLVQYPLRTRAIWMRVIFAFSLAAGIKMSALLHAPGLLVVAIYDLGLKDTAIASIPSIFVHLLLAWPFLRCNAWSYLHNSFEFDREFHWFLSMNWKWLPEAVFHSRTWHVFLLSCTVVFMAIFAIRWYRNPQKNNASLIQYLFASHFVGIVFSRSLHYSFWIWYLHTIPFLLRRRPLVIRIAMFAVLEIAWNHWQGHKPWDMTQSFAVIRGSKIMTIAHFLILVMLLLE
jgi:alpha-1,3-mannosyltransferase